MAHQNGIQEVPKYAELNNLCSEKSGAEILFASDDWFASAENLIQVREIYSQLQKFICS